MTPAPEPTRASAPGGTRAERLQETYEAMVLDWEGLGEAEGRADPFRLRTSIERLVASGVHVIIVTSGPIDVVDAQLRPGPGGRGVLLLCRHRGTEASSVTADGPQLVLRRNTRPAGSDGPAPVAGMAGLPTLDPPNAVGRAARWLAHQGITGRLVLVCHGAAGAGPPAGWVDAFARAAVISIGADAGRGLGAGHRSPGGPDRFFEVVGDQLERRASHRVPSIDLDPGWVVPLPTGPDRQGVAEALGTVGNGSIGVRASPEEGSSTASVLVNGVYARDDQLLAGPDWTGLEWPERHGGRSARRLLDLRGGTLVRRDLEEDGRRSMRFVSAASPHAMALRAESTEAHLPSGQSVRSHPDMVEFERVGRGPATGTATGRAGAQIAVATRDDTIDTSGRRVVDRLAAWVANPYGPVDLDATFDLLRQADAKGFDALLAEHRAAWAQRWEGAGVVIEGDPEAELAARFAVFHLLSAAADTGESAVAARGLTGSAYAGHVFWDADVFVLPALAALRPPAARAMLEYRIRRLPAARDAAVAGGFAGARFPWESARDGWDVTPTAARGEDHELVAIHTGAHEEHIVADVAWAAAQYSAWTGDTSLLTGTGRHLLVDTARYWASRIRTDAEGCGHIDSVIGPDEYHQLVDDNAYTNVMARWNLRRGAELLGPADGDEPGTWRELADGLVDGWCPERGIYEQFAGYFDLEPLVMAGVARPPATVDAVLGTARVAASQLIKQPDALMLHHLVPAEVDGSLRSSLDFYGPRTAHGSSLSPAVHASLHARAGQPDRALELFRMAARLDLDDLTGTTAGGLHLGTMGGVWQALAFGFLGLRARQGTLAVDPCLPDAWTALALRFGFGGQRIGVRAEHDRVTVTCDRRLRVQVADQTPRWCPPGSTTVAGGRTAAHSRH